MACPVLLYPTCKLTETVGEATGGAAAHSGMEALAKSISEAIADLVRTMMTWWVDVPSIDVSREPIIGNLRTWFLPIAVAVTVGGLIAAGARMAVARKANPLIDVTGGLLVIAITAAVGILVPNALLKAGDAWSTWVLDQSIGDQFGDRMAGLLSLAGAGNGFVLIVGIVVLVLSVVQALLMMLREAAIVILIGMLPLAAAGAMAPGMRGWIKRVVAWLLALIFYKPAAAAVYATAFTMIGTGKGIRGQLMGLCALVLAVVALPVLIKFFTFATGSAGQHSGGGILGAATGAMVAMGSLRGGGGGGGGSSAVSQANYTSSHMPPPGGASGAGGGGPQPTPSGAPAPGGDAPQAGSGTGDGGDGDRRGSGTPGPDVANAAASKAGTTGSGTSAGTGAAGATAGTGAGGAAGGGAAGGTAGGGAAGGAAGGASGGAAAGGAAAAGAAGGPVGMAVAGGVAAGQKAADGARNAAGSAMTPDGSESQ